MGKADRFAYGAGFELSRCPGPLIRSGCWLKENCIICPRLRLEGELFCIGSAIRMWRATGSTFVR